MRLTQSASRTLRTKASESEIASHSLLTRAGFIHQLGSGIYSYLPMALKSLKNIERIIRFEMDAVGAQEILMPHIQPMELWDSTNRTTAFGQNLFTLKDRRSRGLVLAPTHEESVTMIAKSVVQSYKDLPFTLYQIQTKFRDEARPRAGLIRVREFAMKDAYSFSHNEESSNEIYDKMATAYKSIYSKCEVPILIAEADSGAIGGKDSHEFIYPTEAGEDTVITCSSCSYTANVEKATGVIDKLDDQSVLPIEEINTPNVTSIQDLCDLLAVSPKYTLKTICYKTEADFVMVAIRGDLNVNEIKLKNILNCKDLHIATTEEVTQAGLIPGSMSPVGITDIFVIADISVMTSKVFIAGANKPNTHFKNVDYARDCPIQNIEEISITTAEHKCSKCENRLESVKGIEIGHIFKLGTFFSETLGALFLDETGQQQPIIMGCYGIGVGRLLAAIVESNHDDKGIIFPKSISPYAVNLISLNHNDDACKEASESIYENLLSQGIDCLFDDRTDKSAGVKFQDAELLGIPLQVIISPRNIKTNQAEIKIRKTLEAHMTPLSDTVSEVINQINQIN
jgi:prolyl-tRNA synthetase